MNVLLVCFQAMKESGHDWPLVSEEEQERQVARLHDTISSTMEDPLKDMVATADGTDQVVAEVIARMKLTSRTQAQIILSESNDGSRLVETLGRSLWWRHSLLPSRV